MRAVGAMRVIGRFRSPICKSETRQQLQYVIEGRLTTALLRPLVSCNMPAMPLFNPLRAICPRPAKC